MGTEAQRYDVVIVGAGFAGLYALHRLRGLGLSARVLRGRRRRRRHLVLEPLSRRALRRREPRLLLLVRGGAPAGVGLDRALRRRSPRSCATSTTSPTASTCGRDIQLDTRVIAATFDEDADAWTVATDDGETSSRRSCVMATGCLSAPQCRGFQGLRDLRGRLVPHRRAGRTRASTSPASASASSAPAPPACRSSPRSPADAATSTSSSARRTSASPTRTPARPRARARRQGRYAEQPRVSRAASRLGVGDPARDAIGARGRRRRSAQRTFQERWDRGGGCAVLARLQRPPHQRGRQRDGRRLRARQDPRDREGPRAWPELLCPRGYPFGTKRLCVDNGYFETFNRDNVTLVDIRDAPIEEITPTRRAHDASASTSSTRSSSPPASTR